MKESLEELIKRIIRSLEEDEQIDKRIDTFVDYKSKYVVLKPLVKVTVESTNGKKYEIDVTDYFKEVVK